DAVYDGQLHPEKDNQKQALILSDNAHPSLMENGIQFIPANHQGCGQKSEEEGRIVRELYLSLLEQSYRNRDGNVKPMSHENILVVAPYNTQVNYLKSILPENAKVGTVDKFQGQEAEVVLVSMTTSSGEDLPRNLEFLYSKNRLNVAISRARTLAAVVANPKLLEIPCSNIEQMCLVNTLCWAKMFAVELTEFIS
ncbi:MAG TPA: C-terminal helicase domain-containing protein, partial [Rhabdochlamydiaceae bacterium]